MPIALNQIRMGLIFFILTGITSMRSLSPQAFEGLRISGRSHGEVHLILLFQIIIYLLKIEIRA